jgi:hypothetical protein
MRKLWHSLALRIAILIFTGIIFFSFENLRLNDSAYQAKVKSLSITATVRAQDPVAQQKATQTALAEELWLLGGVQSQVSEKDPSSELPVYKIDSQLGQLAWIQSNQDVEANQENQAVYRHEFTNVIVRDFIIASDITWFTSSPSSGCGFTLRTHGEGRQLNRYLITIFRVSYGHLQFTALVEGQAANLKEIYFDPVESKFTWENETTNRLAVIARKEVLTIYLNQTFVGEIDTALPPSAELNFPPPPAKPQDSASSLQFEQYNQLNQAYQETLRQIGERYARVELLFEQTHPIFSQGFVGFAAVNHSGQTQCRFSNAWLWDLDIRD